MARDWTTLLTADEIVDLGLLGIDWQSRLEADLANIARIAGGNRKQAFTALGITVDVNKADEQAILAAAKAAAEDVADVLLVTITSACPVEQPALGKPYSYTMSAKGGTAPYAWTLAAAVPKGLTIDGKTGEIAGTAEEPGSFTWVVVVTDAEKRAAKMECTFEVAK